MIIVAIVLAGIASMVLEYVKASTVEYDWRATDEFAQALAYEIAYQRGLAEFDAIADDLYAYSVNEIDDCGAPVRITNVLRNAYLVRSYVTDSFEMRAMWANNAQPFATVGAANVTFTNTSTMGVAA